MGLISCAHPPARYSFLQSARPIRRALMGEKTEVSCKTLAVRLLISDF